MSIHSFNGLIKSCTFRVPCSANRAVFIEIITLDPKANFLWDSIRKNIHGRGLGQFSKAIFPSGVEV